MEQRVDFKISSGESDVIIKEYDAENVVVGPVECIRETNNALLIYASTGEHWIPRSQLHHDSDVYKRGHTGNITVSKWIAKERGFINEQLDFYSAALEQNSGTERVEMS